MQDTQKSSREQFSLADQNGIDLLARISEFLRRRASYHLNKAEHATKLLELPLNWRSGSGTLGNRYFDFPRLNLEMAEEIVSHMHKYHDFVSYSNDLIEHCAKEFPIGDGEEKYGFSRSDLFDIARGEWPPAR